jgi:L-serine dehydratase
MMEVISIDGVSMHMDGDYHETLVWMPTGPTRPVAGSRGSGGASPEANGSTGADQGDRLLSRNPPLGSPASAREMPGPRAAGALAPDIRAPFASCADLLARDGGRGTPFWQLAVEYEWARGNFSEAEVLAKMVEIVRILRASIAEGIAGTTYDDRVLGHQSGRFAELMRAGKLLDGGALNRIILYVTALMEVKSSMGVIVAAPTAGACAALPGAVIAMAESMGQARRPWRGPCSPAD